ncbi:MAG: L,D-transpeptidase family protein [Chthoniobacterales bacterium]
MKNTKEHHYLKISIPQQRLEVFEEKNGIATKKPFASYPISSSQFGLGTEPESFRTPLGKFIIEKKIGEGAPERMIFKARKPTGVIADLGGEEDYVLTRILWLSGLEPENANTRDRFIYIHGTNQEDRLGSPASHGCIRLANAAVIELFDVVEEGDFVEIVT